MSGMRLTGMLGRAAGKIDRLTPIEAQHALENGAKVVDVRSFDSRARDGVIPGSLHIPLTVLQWRLDPDGDWRTPHVAAGDGIVLVCDHGCSSLLAAESLVEMGRSATDVVGGIVAWREAGLELKVAADEPLGRDELPGMRPPYR